MCDTILNDILWSVLYSKLTDSFHIIYNRPVRSREWMWTTYKSAILCFFHLGIKGQWNYCNLMGAAIRTEKICVGRRRQTKLKLHAWLPLYSPCLSFFFFFFLCEKSNSASRQIIRCIRHFTISDTYELGNGSGASPPLKNSRLQKVVKQHEQGQGQGKLKGKGKVPHSDDLTSNWQKTNVYSRQKR